jgi:hypothetical protein
VHAGDQAEQEYLARQAAAAAAAAAQREAEMRLRIQAENLGWGDIDSPDVQARIIPGLGMIAPTKEDAIEIKSKTIHSRTALQLIDDLRQLNAQGASNPTSAQNAAFNAKRVSALAALNKALDNESLSERVIKVLEPAIGSANVRMKLSDTDAALAGAQEAIRLGMREQLGTRGAVPYDTRIGMVGEGKAAQLQRQFAPREAVQGGGTFAEGQQAVPLTEASPLTQAERDYEIHRRQGGGGAPPGE